jgi:hypothetical protein
MARIGMECVIPAGLEPATYGLENRCSIQLSYGIGLLVTVSVGVAGFEPTTSCSQSRRDNQTTLHPDNYAIELFKRAQI